MDVEVLRLEYRRVTGREHPASCEEAEPANPCKCRCNGLLHGIAWRARFEVREDSTVRHGLLKWIS